MHLFVLATLGSLGLQGGFEDGYDEMRWAWKPPVTIAWFSEAKERGRRIDKLDTGRREVHEGLASTSIHRIPAALGCSHKQSSLLAIPAQESW